MSFDTTTRNPLSIWNLIGGAGPSQASISGEKRNSAKCKGCGSNSGPILGNGWCSEVCEVLTQFPTPYLRAHAHHTKKKGKTHLLASVKIVDGMKVLTPENWPDPPKLGPGVTIDHYFEAYKKEGYLVLTATTGAMVCNLLHRLKQGNCLTCGKAYHNELGNESMFMKYDLMKFLPTEFVDGTFCYEGCAALHYAGDHTLERVDELMRELREEKYTPQLAYYPEGKASKSHKGAIVMLPTEIESLGYDKCDFVTYSYTPAEIAKELERRKPKTNANVGNIPSLVRRRA